MDQAQLLLYILELETETKKEGFRIIINKG